MTIVWPLARQMVVAAALTVPLAWLAWQIVTDTAGQVLAASHPETALRWNAKEADALVALVERRLVSPSESGAVPVLNPATPEELATDSDLLKRALRGKPLDPRAVALLGLVAYRQRDIRRADALIALAGGLSWRDPLAQTMLAAQLTRGRHYDRALNHIDAVLRTHPAMQTKLFPSLTVFSAKPESWRAVGHFLATENATWRTAFLRYLCTHLRSETRLAQLYDQLAASTAPPTTAELEPLLRRLVAGGRYVQAYHVWRRSLSADRRAAIAQPYNGAFAHQPQDVPFDWTFLETAGADMRIVDAPSAGGKALRLEFSGARVQFKSNVRQLLLLPAGHYRFTVKARADALHSHRGLWWQVTCAGDDAKILAHTALVVGTMNWAPIGMTFTVPAQACAAQWLTVELPARFDFERQIEGTAWFADARIDPVSKDTRR